MTITSITLLATVSPLNCCVKEELRKLQEQVSHPAGEVAGQVRISIEGQDNSCALHDLRIRAASI